MVNQPMKQSARLFLALMFLLFLSQVATAQVTAEWLPGAVWSYKYSGGVRSGATVFKKFRVTSNSGYINVMATLDATGNSTTTRMWVEDGIDYSARLSLTFGGELAITSDVPVTCFQVAFDSAAFNTSSTVSYSSPLNKSQVYYCPETVTISVQALDEFQVNASDGVFADHVRITWNEVQGTTEYQVYRCTTYSESTCGTEIGITSGNGFDDTGGVLDTIYYYRVIACEQSECGGFSTANPGHRSDTTDDHSNGCGEATLVDADSTTPGDIETAADLDYFRIDLPSVNSLTVNTTGDTDTRGRLYAAVCGQGNLVVNNDSGEGFNFLINRELAEGTYYVSVSHSSGSGTGPYEFVSSIEGSSALPNPPSILAASDGSDEEAVHLDWFPVSLASSYNIYYSETISSPQIFIKRSTGISDSVTGLDPGVIYFFWVYSENSNGESLTGTHNTGYIAVPAATVPDAPDLSSAVPGNHEVELHFSANGDGGAAIISYTASCGAFNESGASSPITVSGLTNGTEYSCSVVATNVIGDSAPSAVLSVMPTAPELIFAHGFDDE